MSKQFQTLCLEKFVLKNVLIGLHESKGGPLEKENEIKIDHYALPPINNLYGAYIKSL